jgi:DNA invertase Pin-like site-specific DNA recombinase
MTTPTPKPLRCAVYTRVSTDAGLEQDFNSLDAQREACEAYIKSQTHEGWRLIKTRFDDGGFSGGNMERPALLALLDEIRERRLDIVVVYKVDRLTRSLADFAKLVELFDAQGVSFVSVTQSFNTTTSMGRLTLNVLLSFAQFEREVTGERIRDKIAASKKKGMWMGGVVPLGYMVKDRKLIVVPKEAETVRLIFDRYRELRSLPALQRDLRARGLVTRERILATGRTIGGVSFMVGALASLLRNRTYLGEINHRGRSYSGEHDAIVDPEVFDTVQAIMDANRQGHREHWRKSDALLVGKLFDDRGNRMTPSYAKKGGVHYRYYVSAALLQGNKADAGSVRRVAAQDIEERVVAAIASHGLLEDGHLNQREAIRAAVDRITVRPIEIIIDFKTTSAASGAPDAIRLAWMPPNHRRRRSITAPTAGNDLSAPPSRSVIRAEARARLLIAIATGRMWLDQLIRGDVDFSAIAEREGRSERSVRMIVSIAFLAPEIVAAAVAGTLPRGLGLSDMTDLPMDWAEQRKALRLPSASGPIDV